MIRTPQPYRPINSGERCRVLIFASAPGVWHVFHGQEDFWYRDRDKARHVARMRLRNV